MTAGVEIKKGSYCVKRHLCCRWAKFDGPSLLCTVLTEEISYDLIIAIQCPL